jgi:hypothetical protein
MAIKFVCSCGKHLRARDEMAARRSVCPRCGAPVGIPSHQPAHPAATLGPMTPTERVGRRPAVVPAKAVLGELGPAAPAPAPTRRAPDIPAEAETDASTRPSAPAARARKTRALAWGPGLVYPLRALPLMAGLALALTALTAGASAAAPDLRELGTTATGWVLGVLLAPCVLIPLLVLGYTCGYLDCTFSAAAAGELRDVRWPGRDIGLVARSGIAWLLCFLGGPVVPAGAALAFWIHCGDPAPVDWLILAELCVLAAGYWLLAVLAVQRRDRLRDANPVAVAALVADLGFRVLLAVLAAAVVAVAHGLLALLALAELHREPAAGLLGLSACWVSGLFLATCWFQLLGGWCRRPRNSEDHHGSIALGRVAKA